MEDVSATHASLLAEGLVIPILSLVKPKYPGKESKIQRRGPPVQRRVGPPLGGTLMAPFARRSFRPSTRLSEACMQRSSVRERAVLVLVLLPLAVTAFQGPHDALHTFPRDRTVGQQVVSVLQLVYGASALVSLVAVAARRRWALGALVAWAISLTLAAALATVVWGGGGLRTALPSGLLVAVVTGLIAWGGAAHARRRPAP